MQADYSHGAGVCAQYRLHTARPGECMTMEEVAMVWMSAIAPLSSADAAAMCVPAVAIAAGCAFNAPGCENKFAKNVQCGTGRGLWQIQDKDKGMYDPDPHKQALTVYKVYTSNNPDYGCLSAWCQQTGCSEAVGGIMQDDTIIENHRFCKGMWTADDYVARVENMGGFDAIHAACSGAAKAKGAGVVGNGARVSSSADETALSDYLTQQLSTIFQPELSATMASQLVEAMVMNDILTMQDAQEKLGKGAMSKVKEICTMARVDLEPMLLKEWLRNPTL
jgi:hypothetical protein